jgi:hypothetical protein
MVTEKAKALKIPKKLFEKMLRDGKAELLAAVLSTAAGSKAYAQWRDEHPDEPGQAQSPQGRLD